MKEDETVLTEEELAAKPEPQPDLNQVVLKEGPLKQMLVDYVGTKLQLNPETDQVTLEMIIGVVADEFAEFPLAIAEENFIRGYKQALNDVDFVKKEQSRLKTDVRLEEQSKCLDDQEIVDDQCQTDAQRKS